MHRAARTSKEKNEMIEYKMRVIDLITAYQVSRAIISAAFIIGVINFAQGWIETIYVTTYTSETALTAVILTKAIHYFAMTMLFAWLAWKTMPRWNRWKKK